MEQLNVFKVNIRNDCIPCLVFVAGPRLGLFGDPSCPGLSASLALPSASLGPDGTLSCRFCGQAFQNAFNLKRHMFKHTGEKPYHCTVCLRSFTRSDNLKTHMKVHTGEKPYKCEVCEASFASHGSLRLHELNSHASELSPTVTDHTWTTVIRNKNIQVIYSKQQQ